MEAKSMKISRKGMKRGVKQTRTVLPPSRKGRNKRGVCGHKSTRYVDTYKVRMKAIQTGYAPTTKFLELEELAALMEDYA
jgi:hypothetical protein